MIHTLETGRSSDEWIAEAVPAEAQQSRDQLAAATRLLQLEQGLYAIAIGEATCPAIDWSGVILPAVQLSTPAVERRACVEIIGSSGTRDPWVGTEGGTVIVRAPAGGGHLLVTAFGLPGQPVSIPNIDVHRLDRSRLNGASTAPAIREPEEVPIEIVLHIERLGDRRFPGRGWIGNRGKRLRIEAFSIRPLETLLARDVEFKALGPKQRQTPWVTDAKLCGTRGQRMPLTGFAIRLAPHVGEQFDIVYEGAFFESGVVGPHRNGEPCVPPLADDPLEAIQVRIIRRPAG